MFLDRSCLYYILLNDVHLPKSTGLQNVWSASDTRTFILVSTAIKNSQSKRRWADEKEYHPFKQSISRNNSLLWHIASNNVICNIVSKDLITNEGRLIPCSIWQARWKKTLYWMLHKWCAQQACRSIGHEWLPQWDHIGSIVLSRDVVISIQACVLNIPDVSYAALWNPRV